MSRYTKLLAMTFPNYYARRSRALDHYKAKYDAETAGRTYQRKTETRGPNESNEGMFRVGKYVMREMEQNNDLVVGALDVFCANIVGTGLVPEPLVLNRDGTPNKEVNDALAKWFRIWAKRPEVTWQYTDGQAQWLECRTWARDGGALCRDHLGPRNNLAHGSDVPYSYQLFEPDFLYDMPITSQSGRTVFNGVEVGAWSRPVAYHIYRSHPDELLTFNQRVNEKPLRVPTDRMRYLKHATRINQLIGVTRFHSVIKRLNDVGEIEETERVAARVAASLAAVITKGEPSIYDPQLIDDDTGERDMRFRPGMVFDDLHPGENVESLGSNRPNNELIAFRASQLRAASGGFGISYSSWSKDFSGTYSSQRQELVEQHMLYTPVWAKYCASACQPRYEKFVTAAELAGLVDLRNVDPDTIFDAMWTQPVVPWIDPLKEVKAWRELLDGDLETKAGINRLRGKNPRDVERQRQLEANDDEEMVDDDPEPDLEPGGDQDIRGNRLGSIG